MSGCEGGCCKWYLRDNIDKNWGLGKSKQQNVSSAIVSRSLSGSCRCEGRVGINNILDME